MKRPTIAFYAAEYAIDDDLPIFAGGLGVLAADFVLEAGAEGWPLVAFGAAYQQADAAKSSTQSHGRRLYEAGFRRAQTRAQRPFETIVDLGDWAVKAGAWVKHFGRTRLFLIDTDLRGNSDLSRRLTANLYDPDLLTRLLQQFVMARASVALMDELGIVPDRYHMNEGHMAFVPLVLAAHYRNAYGAMPLAKALKAVRPRLVGTKHTILPGAGDFADEATLERLFGRYLERYGWTAAELLKAGAKDGDPETFSTTALMIRSSVRSSAVSRLHAEVEHVQHPSSVLVPVTNGVRRERWQSPNLRRGLSLSNQALWRRHETNRRSLIKFTNEQLGTALDPDRLTVVWARRFAPYKRPTLIFHDVRRLQRIMGRGEGLQLIISGNANKVDEEGMRYLESIIRHAQDPGFERRLAYLPHYATDVARRLTSGADVWLNTPVRGWEASGTSGMKAGLNGALQLSTKDGWVDEIDLNEVGWELPADNTAQALYETLEQQVMRDFYTLDSEGLPHAWIERMRAAMRLTETQFTAARMLEDYRKRLYKL
jgi:glycogen phosphorylase